MSGTEMDEWGPGFPFWKGEKYRCNSRVSFSDEGQRRGGIPGFTFLERAEIEESLNGSLFRSGQKSGSPHRVFFRENSKNKRVPRAFSSVQD